MNKALFIIFFPLFLTLNTVAQHYTFIKSLDIDQPTEVSIDRGGNIYFATFDGDVIKLNNQLVKQQIFSPPNPNSTQILDAWQGLRIFTFHRELQLFRLINRNLSLHEDYRFPVEKIGFAELATSSFDNNVWLIDQTDFSLKKYVIKSQEIGSNTPLQLILNPDDYELLHGQEYQNRLFISTRNAGILIFDNFGNYIRTFNYPGIEHFSFWKDYLYFLIDGQMIQINLYTDEIKKIDMTDDYDWKFALIYDGFLYLFSENIINLYQQKNPE
jgi:hypothetical protein